ncbi:Sodium leak channel non-selective protein [Aphelenchoides besseyi]|nr:Sodium leak channel non-selective protein [Aphelenchoides besseyi]
MGCILARVCDPTPPEAVVRDFWHIGGVLIDVNADDPQNLEEQRVQRCSAGVLYVFNSRLIYRARHCTFSRGNNGSKFLQYQICDIQDVNSFNKFTSRKDQTIAQTVIDVTITPTSNPADVLHVGFVTRDADKIAQRLQEICLKHKSKPKIFQFNSVDVLVLILFLCNLSVANSQLSAMFGNPIQAENCAEWTSWQSCIWLKGSPRFNRSYFHQLLPGRTGCRDHVFFKLLSERWGVAFNNFYNYLRDITESEQQCGECSYQQSCGRQCHRRGAMNTINPLFVAERRCEGIDQSTACVSKQVKGTCTLWPNSDIQLPNVTDTMTAIINGIQYLNCIPEFRPPQNVQACPQNNNKETPTASPRRSGTPANTQERLFGSSDAASRKAKKVTDTFRSQIFANDGKPSPPRTPKKSVPVLERNPITVGPMYENVIDFDAIDQNKDNSISFPEFEKWFEAHKQSQRAQNVVFLFKSYDSNNDNRLSISEFVPLAYEINRPAESNGDAIFKHFDLDKDSLLTRNELERSNEHLGSEIIEGLFSVADANRDQRISYEEFEKISGAFGKTSNSNSQKTGVARTLMDSMDTNKDKLLSEQEVYNFVNQFNRVDERTVSTAFQQLDSNQDRYLNLSELEFLPQREPTEYFGRRGAAAHIHVLEMSGTARILGFSACKAATISSAMLSRRKSSGTFSTSVVVPEREASGKNTVGNGPNITGSRLQAARESVAVLAELLTMDSITLKGNFSESIVHMTIFSTCLKLACFLSMISVCMHTPQTIALIPGLQYGLLVVDLLVTMFFTFEALLKINKDFFRDRWSQFDLALLFFHYLAIGLHCYELMAINFPRLGLNYEQWYGIIRSPRPFIMIRLVRLIVHFKLPKNRIQQIIKRSSQQIQNVTIFFLFFMTLYAIMGVQLFGQFEYHCVLPGTDPNNVTINDLMIPDSMCSKPGYGGYQCPPNMECMNLKLNAKTEGYSLFTVYLAASQEGWVYVLYDCLDSFPSYMAFLYFVSLIFFMAWLVKNVFIAVITETFAEIRVQFSEMWQSKDVANEENFHRMKLQNTVDGWKLSAVDSDIELSNTPRLLSHFVRSTSFQIGVMFLVLLNALVNASFVHYHDRSDDERKEIYYFIEVGFTILFNIECLLKLIALSWSGYIKRGAFKFELILCIGSTFNIIPILYGTHIFTYFQVFRIIRLIKASPMLEDFLYKIFGPGKKLGGLVILTMILLIIASAVSLQLFCHVLHLDKFQTFPQAFMTMFQIMTQEGWTEVAIEILRSMNEPMVPFVAIYFVGYHLFVTLIVLSLFVAVILDNLEMDEELKKIKQLKAREETTMRTTLPWRLRVFEKFPTRPQMVQLRKVSSEFPVPKVRDSFTRQFAELSADLFSSDSEKANCPTKRLLPGQPFLRQDLYEVRVRQIGQLSSKTSIACLIEESNKNRLLLSDSTQFIAQRSGPRRRDHTMRHRQRGLNATNSVKAKAVFEHLKENGDLRPTDSAQKNNLKQGEIDIKTLQQKRAQAEFTRNRIEEEMRENHPFFDRPLFAVGRDSNLRRICQNIVYARYSLEKIDPISGKPVQLKYKQIHSLFGLMTYLDWAMVFMTGLSCCSMLFESPWPPTGEYLVFNNVYLQICEYAFVVAMTFELVVKIIANGLFFTPKAVVRDVGGVMTVFIYITSFWYLAWMPKHVEINSVAQLLMIFRAMRPLRIYTLVPQIRRVVVELCKGFKEIILVTILLVLLVFVFASFGVQTVGGKLAGCTDPTINSRENCSGLFEQKLFVTRIEVYGKNQDDIHPTILVPRVWSNPRNFNFDHIGNAMLALFETLSYKGWNVVRDVLLAREGPWAALFIHFYVFIGSMIGITLFVGVVVANYMENRGTALLTVDQRRWHDLKARLRMAQPLHVPPKPSESAKLRIKLYELTMSRSFKQFFVILVVVNSATLVIPWNVDEEQTRSTYLFVLTAISAICNILFTIEILLKIVAFTFRGFWQSKRNRIDLLITILGIAWIAGHYVIALPASVVAAQARLKRFTYTFGYMVVILRFFTIAGRKSTLKMLMLTVLMSMVRSLYIISAMFLLVLFYAYTGVILFGTVKYQMATAKHVNFRSGKEALVVLFRSVTGEDWNDIMHDCMRSPPLCYWKEGIDYWKTDCGNYFGAIFYFCSFYLIITYIVLNLLVAIIMANFSLFYANEEGNALLSYSDIRNFQLVWNAVDIDQRGVIPVRRVKFLLRLLKGRLEVDPTKDRLLFKHMVYEMEKLHNGDDVSFHDILNMLSYRSVDIRKSLQLEELLQREELEYIIEEEVAKYTIRAWLEACLRRIKQEERQQGDQNLITQIRLSGPALPIPRASLVEINLTTKPEIADTTDEQTIAEVDRAQRAKTVRGRRRSSIPDLVSEAKKLVWGVRVKSLPPQSTLPDRPNIAVISSEPNAEVRTIRKSMTNQPPRIERRSTLKQLQTCDLPDVEEWAEDGDESGTSSTDRRHSLEANTLSRMDSTRDSVRRPSSSRPSGTTPEPTNIVHQQPTTFEVQMWWNELISQ